MRHLKIKIEGDAGAGKTALMHCLAMYLEDCKVEVVCREGKGPEVKAHQIFLADLLEPMRVEIQTVQEGMEVGVMLAPGGEENGKTVLVSPLLPATDEEQELCNAAVRAVLATVRAARASGKYQAYAWVEETEENQVHHAFEHVRELEKKYGGYTMFQPDEDHLAHLLTRAAILQAKIDRKAAEAKG